MDDFYWQAGFWFAAVTTGIMWILAWAFEVADEEEEK